MNNIGPGVKKCSFCGEDINFGSRRCPFCGSLIETASEAVKSAGIYESGPNGHTSSFDLPVSNGGAQPENVAEVSEPLIGAGVADSESNPMPQGAGKAIYDTAAQANGAYVPQGQVFSNMPNGHYMPDNFPVTRPLGNGMKVFLTTICAIVPGIGQLTALIAAIVFMNSSDDHDRRSFGVALMVAALANFVISCFFYFILFLAFIGRNV